LILLLLAAGAVFFLARRPPAPASPVAEVPFVLPISPVGIVPEIPEEIVWREVPGASGYEVEILDGRLESFWKRSTKTGRLPFPEEAAGRLRAGEALHYRIRAKRGFPPKDLAVSEPVFFQLSQPVGP
jgi:hypothetical protein